MRALLERSRSARVVACLAAFCTVLPLVHAASAQDVFGFRLETLWPELRPSQPPAPAEAAVPQHHRHARRIWAASHARPLRIALARRKRETRVAARRRAVHVAQTRPSAEPQVVFPKLIVLPKPPRPAIVSIYQDRTLRDGDAVMMGDGIHVFRAKGQWPYKPRDFVRLTLVAALDWRLRQTLDVLDRNPPTRWSSNGTTAG